MAQQKSIFRLRGTIGGVNFYKSKDGYLAREKSSLDGGRITHDPAFRRTRENLAEFTEAAQGGKLVRQAFRPQLLNAADHRMSARLMGRMIKVVKSDSVNARGERRVKDGAIQLLEGFDFNQNGKLNSTLYASYVIRLDRVAGQCEVHIPSFIPDEGVTMPEGTTHFKLVSGCAVIDFEQRLTESVFAESPLFPGNSSVTDEVTLQHSLSSGVGSPLILTLGVQFYQEVNGAHYPLKNGAFNALGVLKVA